MIIESAYRTSRQGISNIEQGISNNEVKPTFYIYYSLLDIRYYKISKFTKSFISNHIGNQTKSQYLILSFNPAIKPDIIGADISIVVLDDNTSLCKNIPCQFATDIIFISFPFANAE